jgi:hypothetical protein
VRLLFKAAKRFVQRMLWRLQAAVTSKKRHAKEKRFQQGFVTKNLR